jgi:hypothetical protein
MKNHLMDVWTIIIPETGLKGHMGMHLISKLAVALTRLQHGITAGFLPTSSQYAFTSLR